MKKLLTLSVLGLMVLGANMSFANDSEEVFGGGGHHKKFVCTAQNKRGHVFKAYGRDRHHTQHEALKLCRHSSKSCKPTGCRAIHH